MITIDKMDLSGKRVIIRCDLNVPIKGGILEDDTRIKRSVKTIKYALNNADRVIILSHLGRIKSIEDKKKNSLKIVCDRLSELLGKDICFCTYEENINEKINNNKIVMLENVRFFDLDNKKESNNDEELSRFYASFADIFVNDAFGVSHRESSSIVGISKLLPSCIGFLVKEEIDKLNELLYNPKKPFIIILGGAKVSDKIGIISNLIDKVDKIIIVGAMAFTFLKANNINVGKSLVDEDSIEYCKKLLKRYNSKIVLPIDVYVSDNIDSKFKEKKDITNISINDIAFDIGEKTIENIKKILINAETVFLNGPAGAFEYEMFSYGTKSLFEVLKNSPAKVIIGGGDSASAAMNFGYGDSFYHISTGGGSSLKFLEGKELKGFQNIGE